MFITRSNYFAVRNRLAFLLFCKRCNLHAITDTRDPSLHGFIVSDDLMAEWHGSEETTDEETAEEENNEDYLSELPRHIADGHVAVVIQVGSDKARFLFAHAWAFNNKGDIREADIDAIYAKAQELGSTVTRAEY